MTKRLSIAVCALLAVAVVTWPARTDAATISVEPSVKSVTDGQSFDVNIVISDLAVDEEVAAFAFWLSWDEAILSGLSYTPDPDNAMGGLGCLDCDLSFGFGPFDPLLGIPAGVGLDVFFAADFLLDAEALKSSQLDGFILATLSFQAIAPGITTLALSNAFASTLAGFSIDADIEDAVVCVNRPAACAIIAPEPGSLALFGLGAAALAAARRRRARV